MTWIGRLASAARWSLTAAVCAGLGSDLAAQVTTDSVFPRPVGLEFEKADDAPLPAERELTASEIARRALPAVVEIRTYRASGERLGSGSGFVVSPEGLVVTSHHVLERAHRAEIILPTGDVFEVQHVSAADSRRDLAVLRIAGFGLDVVPLGDSRDVEVGEPVVVIGSPLGLFNTVSAGLVSARREIEGRQVIQLSAPISVGSSGGPVFDRWGRAIGVLAGFMRRGQNVNFAVPIEYVRGLIALPEHALTIEAVGRRRVSLIGETGTVEGGISLSNVLHGESVPGEENTPWARETRWVNAEHVKADPVTLATDLAGTWDLRELTRMPGTKSGLYRGVLVADESGLEGQFFGSLRSDPVFEEGWAGDRVRDFQGDVERSGRVTLRGGQGCRYFLHASPSAMTGVYECTDRGSVYDLGAVELRRTSDSVGVGPTGVYAVEERIPLGANVEESRGLAVLLATPDGRFLGALQVGTGAMLRTYRLLDGRWTEEGMLTARLRETDGPVVSGRFEEGRIEVEYPVGDADYRVPATIRGALLRSGSEPPTAPEKVPADEAPEATPSGETVPPGATG